MHFLVDQLFQTLFFKVILIYKLQSNIPAVEKYRFFWLLLLVTLIKCFYQVNFSHVWVKRLPTRVHLARQ